MMFDTHSLLRLEMHMKTRYLFYVLISVACYNITKIAKGRAQLHRKTFMSKVIPKKKRRYLPLNQWIYKAVELSVQFSITCTTAKDFHYGFFLLVIPSDVQCM